MTGLTLRDTPDPVRVIRHVLVVGAGVMGSQIAMTAALANYHVSLVDISPGVLERANKQLRTRLERRAQKGTIAGAAIDAAFEQLRTTTSLDNVTDVQLVVEASTERLGHKQDLFRDLAHRYPDAMLCSNSSSFVPSRLAEVVPRPELVCNIHFFNPALVMPCVEVVPGPQTSEQTARNALDWVASLGKSPVLLNREIRGFIANRILNALRDEAIYLLEEGIADVEAIDEVCRGALGHPMGPFELMDLTGLDINLLTKLALAEETGRPEHGPSKAVSDRYARGDLGQKSGGGWYVYDSNGKKIAVNQLT